MHKRKPDFDPLKFTPKVIHNKLNISDEELIRYFKYNSLKDCAEKFSCSETTVKRKLRLLGIDTSKHNNSSLAKERAAVRNNKQKPSRQELEQLYIYENLDTKTIAEMYGLHYNTIRKITKDSGLLKTAKDVSRSMMSRHLREHGVAHPAQRPDVIKKTSISLNKVNYRGNCFKSLTEYGFALYLDSLELKYYYEEMRVPYVDMITGKRRIYIIDFTIEYENGEIHWVEVKPNEEMIPEDKRVYASRRAEESNVTYRGLTKEERAKSWDLIKSGSAWGETTFLYRLPRSTSKKITYYFKTLVEANEYKLAGWKQFTKPKNDGKLWKLTLVRE